MCIEMNMAGEYSPAGCEAQRRDVWLWNTPRPLLSIYKLSRFTHTANWMAGYFVVGVCGCGRVGADQSAGRPVRLAGGAAAGCPRRPRPRRRQRLLQPPGEQQAGGEGDGRERRERAKGRRQSKRGEQGAARGKEDWD